MDSTGFLLSVSAVYMSEMMAVNGGCCLFLMMGGINQVHTAVCPRRVLGSNDSINAI